MTDRNIWTPARVIKPVPNFESLYQGADGTRPIAFPGTLDLFAEKNTTGYDPNLLAGISVPLGAQVKIWIPQTIAGYTIDSLYQYQILWRLRSVQDYITGQADGLETPTTKYSSYHLMTNPLGQPNALPPSPTNERFFLPGAIRTVNFVQTEPSDLTSPSVVTLRSQMMEPAVSPAWVPPLAPNGEDAVWQQGVYVDSDHPNTGGPSWLTFSCIAEGDEMTILAYKIPPVSGPTPAWDFTTASPGDLSFSNTYGTGNGAHAVSPFSAILVMTGPPIAP